MNCDGTNQNNVSNHSGGNYQPTWSPDDKYIAFFSNRDNLNQHNLNQIYIMNTDGSNQKNISNSNSHENSPSWSPKGDKILFLSWYNNSYDIYTMNIDGSNKINLTRSIENEDSPSWANNGDKIIFSRGKNDKNRKVFIMNSDGSNIQMIESKYDEDITCPVWIEK